MLPLIPYSETVNVSYCGILVRIVSENFVARYSSSLREYVRWEPCRTSKWFITNGVLDVCFLWYQCCIYLCIHRSQNCKKKNIREYNPIHVNSRLRAHYVSRKTRLFCGYTTSTGYSDVWFFYRLIKLTLLVKCGSIIEMLLTNRLSPFPTI